MRIAQNHLASSCRDFYTSADDSILCPAGFKLLNGNLFCFLDRAFRQIQFQNAINIFRHHG